MNEPPSEHLDIKILDYTRDVLWIMNLQFDDTERNVECRLVECTGGVEGGDNLLGGVLR